MNPNPLHFILSCAGICLQLILLPLMSLHGQDNKDRMDHWQHLDPLDDSILGISTYKAREFLQGRQANTVVVAIIDNGAELSHEDLQGMFWVNEDEIPENGVDDDGNGYIDDINGWNFLGNSSGENLKMETTGLARYCAALRAIYGELRPREIMEQDQEEYRFYLELKRELDSIRSFKLEQQEYCERIVSTYEAAQERMAKHLGKEVFSEQELRGIQSKREAIMNDRKFLLQFYDRNISIEDYRQHGSSMELELNTRLNPDFDNRARIVGDDPDDLNDSIYGNHLLSVRGPYHGTGVASLVGASNNGLGIDGVARHVRLMILRIVPNGDERDKDIALAIRYAVNNGADIINCSFGKKYSMHPDFVEGAIRLAEARGVLIINGAGNNGTNNDRLPYYPRGVNEKGERSEIWLSVGASRQADDPQLLASFSNYGKNSVDIFAPGYQVKNCALNSGYDLASGTSVAAPLVAGIAAVLRSYYPHLRGRDLKRIILASAYFPVTREVYVPGENDLKKDLSELSLIGGIANLYRAVRLAEREQGTSEPLPAEPSEGPR